MGIHIQNVCKNFGDFQALDQINLDINDGKLVALLGPSGSGKSTLLRVIAGLEEPDTGRIIINGQDTTHLDVRRRNIGFVFQHYALFKHLTIRENIAFGLEIRKYPRPQIKKRVQELLELIQLEGLGDRYPSQLSGGQRQRIALARALAVEPKVLLLDEPFGALDAKVRKELRAWLRRLHDEVHVTSVFVTHDQEEAMEVADEIVVMNKGKIEQIGSAKEIYDQPATPFVMSFVGPVNILPSHTNLFKDYGLHTAHQEVFIRPHDIEITTEPEGVSAIAFVRRITHLGWEVQLELLSSEKENFVVTLNREKFAQINIREGQQVFVKPIKSVAFENKSVVNNRPLAENSYF